MDKYAGRWIGRNGHLSPSHQSTASAPVVSLESSVASATSSAASSSAAARYSKRGKNAAAAAKGEVTNIPENSSVCGSKNQQGKAKKIDRKWTCPRCDGDVRYPAPVASKSAGSGNGEGGEGDYLKVALDTTTAMCAYKICPAPRYHVS